MTTSDKYSLKRHLLKESTTEAKLAQLLTATIDDVHNGATLGQTIELIRTYNTHEIPFSDPHIVEIETTPELAQAIADQNPDDLVQKPLDDGWVSSNYLVPSGMDRDWY
tara:strand:+ start:50 stop:376 length:327 start_codon:yes stop_codon:yes gene_type:complete